MTLEIIKRQTVLGETSEERIIVENDQEKGWVCSKKRPDSLMAWSTRDSSTVVINPLACDITELNTGKREDEEGQPPKVITPWNQDPLKPSAGPTTKIELHRGGRMTVRWEAAWPKTEIIFRHVSPRRKKSLG